MLVAIAKSYYSFSNLVNCCLFVCLQSRKSNQTKHRKQEPGDRQSTKTNARVSSKYYTVQFMSQISTRGRGKGSTFILSRNDFVSPPELGLNDKLALM